ncbi:acyltransferase [Campylobacter ureolyticus]|uniref:acyltransferase n=1 Tax=Campylobacter ureolyticus TaxID=827 RepID=UPI0022B311D2|nr:acyltransferase [Campylobacter ureolyticus]MCZ6111938.1 acyltransferase [Campylobacter ureolyticus]MDK8323432.1 acyltransferase [Campylobacter ureolyticus]
MNIHKFNLIYSHFIKLFLIIFPDSPLVMRFRGWCYSLAMKKCGKNLQVASTAVLRGIENIYCGDNVYIGPNSYIMAREKITIESEVLIAMNCVVVDSNHGKDIKTNSYRYNRGSQAEIIIGKGSWIAANCVVTSGSNIKPGTLIPPCSVVRKQKD